MKYSQATAELLERMNRVALRQEFVFDKPKIKELVIKSYEMFNLPVPKIDWVKDITDEHFLEAAWAARAAWAAWAAGAAGAAWAAWAAWAARAAGAAWAARATEAAGAASDYDGQEFIFTFEFLQTNKG